MNKIIPSIFVLILMIGVSSAEIFNSEVDATAYRNKIISSPKFVEIKIDDITASLDDTNLKVQWSAMVYDSQIQVGDRDIRQVLALFSDVTEFPKNTARAVIEAELKDLATEKGNALNPNPTVRYENHPLYKQTIKFELK